MSVGTLSIETPDRSLAPVETGSLAPVETVSRPDRDNDGSQPKQTLIRRAVGALYRVARAVFQYLSLVTFLALMTALPLVQLIAFGYLLDVAGRLARGERLDQAVAWREIAGRLGLAAIVLFLFSLPIQLLAHWAVAAEIIDPSASSGSSLRTGASLLALAALLYVSWAWVRGGRLRHYLWPAPLVWLRSFWRPSIWLSGADRLLQMLRELELLRLFWLGLRGALATLIWLLPATVIIAAERNGQTGLAGLVGAIAFICLGIALLYLPMLQANFAAENRFRAMFAVRRIREDFCRAPWAWTLAMFVTLVLLPIPLYLLKIEPPPPELIWLPTWFFILLMLPARIACGLALRRSRRLTLKSGWWPAITRWTARLAMPPIVATYLLFVYLSQYVSWDGLQTWIQQHAVLVPVPFVIGG